MTTLKPQLIRADTLDLQSADSPSAKDHSRQPTYSSAGSGPAPHQNKTLRNAEQDALQEQMQGPRVMQTHGHGQAGYTSEPNFYDDQDDELHDGSTLHNEQGAMSIDDSGIDDSEIGDQGDDDNLDDDLMDKISSSPSIDDGKIPLSIIRPLAMNPIASGPAHSMVNPIAQTNSTALEDYPIHFPSNRGSLPRGHQLGKYSGFLGALRQDTPPRNTEALEQEKLVEYQETEADDEDFETGFALNDLHPFLVPLDDPRLCEDQSLANDGDTIETYSSEDDEWEDVYDTKSHLDNNARNFIFADDQHFIDCDRGGECLQETEDIDFEFVYALHTFVATVEGQANATKGDTMVLLDDSNSYWWLVRVVKDGSIGYLPAEHIETPTERLARLNKHRNIDLSATMLGDNPEKSKNPLKKAIRRRNAKTVQFAAPQYYEPSDYGYSDDEEDLDDELEEVDDGNASLGGETAVGQELQGDQTGVGAPVRNGSITSENGIQNNLSLNSIEKGPNSPDQPLSPGGMAQEDQNGETHSWSKKGQTRNTDSFFKDDSVETKKMTLTPRLLRNDSEANASNATSDLKAKSSLDTFDRIVSPESERFGDEKKKKEKKGMLGGLFKRKDKKNKAQEAEIEEARKSSEELSRKKSAEFNSQDTKSKGPQRQTSKLQKQPPPHVAAKTSPSKENLQKSESSPHPSMDSTFLSPSQESSSTPSTLRSPAPGMSRAHESVSPRSSSPEMATDRPSSPRAASPNAISPVAVSPTGGQATFVPLTDTLKPVTPMTSDDDRSADATPTPGKLVGIGSGMEEIAAEDRYRYIPEPQHAPPAPRQAPPKLVTPTSNPYRERLSESPIEVSPIEPVDSQQSSLSQPPTLMVDTSSASERRSVSPISPTSTSSISIVDVDAETPNDAEESSNQTATSPTADAPTPSTTRSTPTWSDASLRTYMDNDDDIRDLLIIVHDKSNVTPAGPDHPITGNLFSTEKGRLTEMQSNLDSLLNGWLARKNQALRLSRS